MSDPGVSRACYPTSLRLQQGRGFEARTVIDIGAAEGAFFLARTGDQLFPSDATLYQCYATFVPRSMDFRKGAPWCLPDQEPIALQQLRDRRASVRKSIEDLVRHG